MHDSTFPGSRCETPHFPLVPVLPPSLAVNGRELGDTGCRGDRAAHHDQIIDFVTVPPDAAGSRESFRC
jgi:hypothetical protein